MSSNGAPLIQLQGIKKVFYTDEVETHALADVHLEIKQGDYVSIAGPSGCGKTTLLSLLGLLDTPTEGTYLLEDRPVANLSAAERARIRNRRIGFIFQAFNLIGDLTVYENVELPLTYRGMGGAERKQRVQAALERVGMSHRAKHYPAQLSGGQQQRVAVARAVVGDPAILLADEPTGNLDSSNGEAVMELLRELHRGGATVCMVTHDPRYAQHADRTVALFDGRVVESPHGLVSSRIDQHGKGRVGRGYAGRSIFTEPLWQEIRSQQQAFSSLFAWANGRWDLSSEGEAVFANGFYVSGSFFDALGVHPHIGRLFTELDDQKGCGSPGVVLSYGFWQARLGGDARVIGQTIMLDRRPFPVLGVTPPGCFGVEVGS